MELFLVGLEPDLLKAWEKEFFVFKEVYIIEADILTVAENCIVSPANSYGHMDGGIDLYYTEFFGIQLQNEVQNAIQIYCKKNITCEYLPVGASVFVKTSNKKIPYMISAPTMVGPGPVGQENCFFAMAAVLNSAWENRDKIKKLFCPGLATGTGRVAYHLAAREMADAYRKWIKKYGRADID